MNKTCSKCQQSKPLDSFHKRKQGSKDGFRNECKDCWSTRCKSYYVQNKEEHQIRCQEYYKANKEFLDERNKQWVQKNKDKVKEHKKKWELANPDSLRERTRRRRAKKKNLAVGIITVVQLNQKIDYWGRRCWVCKDQYEEMDHVKPLSKGGLHVLSNLRPICVPCNRRKSSTWPFIP